MLAGGAPAAGRTTRNRPPVLRIQFQSAGSAYSVVTNGGRFAFINTPPGPPAAPGGTTIFNFTGGVLVDETTGRRRVISRPGCYALALGAPWVVFDCTAAGQVTYELYSMATGAWSTLSVPAGDNPSAVGRYWIEDFDTDTGTDVFQLIGTGQITTPPAWRPGGRVIPDLNSQNLGVRLCSPLRVPSDWTPYANWGAYPFNERLHQGSVTSDGRFAVLSGQHTPPPPAPSRRHTDRLAGGPPARSAIRAAERGANLGAITGALMRLLERYRRRGICRTPSSTRWSAMCRIPTPCASPSNGAARTAWRSTAGRRRAARACAGPRCAGAAACARNLRPAQGAAR